MCGRYTLSTPPKTLTGWFELRDPPADLAPRYNIAPSQRVPVVANDAPHTLQRMRWGLVPSWAKDPSVGNRMINARAETVAEKPAFRTAFRRRRCLVPASGFYEWRREADGSKTPMLIRPRTAPVLAFAGLWEEWTQPDGALLRSCTILTTTPNAVMAPIHDRMPVILAPSAFAAWLAPTTEAAALTPFLVPCRDDLLESYAVSRIVNNPRNDVVECITPA